MPASSEEMAGSVRVPSFTTLFSGSFSELLLHMRVGGGSPPVAIHTKDTVCPGFTTIGSSTSNLMDGEAAGPSEDLQIRQQSQVQML